MITPEIQTNQSFRRFKNDIFRNWKMYMELLHFHNANSERCEKWCPTYKRKTSSYLIVSFDDIVGIILRIEIFSFLHHAHPTSLYGCHGTVF